MLLHNVLVSRDTCAILQESQLCHNCSHFVGCKDVGWGGKVSKAEMTEVGLIYLFTLKLSV